MDSPSWRVPDGGLVMWTKTASALLTAVGMALLARDAAGQDAPSQPFSPRRTPSEVDGERPFAQRPVFTSLASPSRLFAQLAPASGTETIEGVKKAQNKLEEAGLKRGAPPAPLVGAAAFMMPTCFMVNYGNFSPAALMGGPCKYFFVPGSLLLLVVAPFVGKPVEELEGPSAHHLDVSVYALDYTKKSALTGQLKRKPEGGILGNNLGYDVGYTYIHPRIGLIGYGHATLQQTTIAEADYLNVSNNFFKLDAQIGLDVVRLLANGDRTSAWHQHTFFFRAGPSFFYDWMVARDTSGERSERASVKNPLNQSIGLVSALGYEVGAEIDVRFPWSLGGLHGSFERGSYPSIAFPQITGRDAAFVALVGFDDLRAGDTYTWQRLKLELELPIGYSRRGGVFLGGQILRYENNFGTGVDNRGVSLDYRFRYQ